MRNVDVTYDSSLKVGEGGEIQRIEIGRSFPYIPLFSKKVLRFYTGEKRFDIGLGGDIKRLEIILQPDVSAPRDPDYALNMWEIKLPRGCKGVRFTKRDAVPPSKEQDLPCHFAEMYGVAG